MDSGMAAATEPPEHVPAADSLPGTVDSSPGTGPHSPTSTAKSSEDAVRQLFNGKHGHGRESGGHGHVKRASLG